MRSVISDTLGNASFSCEKLTVPFLTDLRAKGEKEGDKRLTALADIVDAHQGLWCPEYIVKAGSAGDFAKLRHRVRVIAHVYKMKLYAAFSSTRAAPTTKHPWQSQCPAASAHLTQPTTPKWASTSTKWESKRAASWQLWQGAAAVPAQNFTGLLNDNGYRSIAEYIVKAGSAGDFAKLRHRVRVIGQPAASIRRLWLHTSGDWMR